MPALAHDLPLVETYASDAGSSPTRTAASFGVIPRVAFNMDTRSATSARIVFAVDWPSRILAPNCNHLRTFVLDFVRQRAEHAAYEPRRFLGAVHFGKFDVFANRRAGSSC